jgi:hypothetical protein
MRRTPVVSAVWCARDRQQVENQQHDPDIYGRVGDIKDKIVTAKRMKIEIINDGAMNNAINRVAQGSANNQSEADGWQCGSGSREPPP